MSTLLWNRLYLSRKVCRDSRSTSDCNHYANYARSLAKMRNKILPPIPMQFVPIIVLWNSKDENPYRVRLRSGTNRLKRVKNVSKEKEKNAANQKTLKRLFYPEEDKWFAIREIPTLPIAFWKTLKRGPNFIKTV